MSFNNFKFKKEIMTQITEAGYTNPTPIQEKAIPYILEGKDVLGLAKTGTGKTAAFALPILEKLGHRDKKGVRALIIAPTRELAEQINNSIKQLSKLTNLKSCTVYGGVSSKLQIDNLKKGMDIVVGCPGRLLDHITQKHLILNKLEVLVLDEADHMLDMGFLKDIKKIMKETPKGKQTLLFSATMPQEIKTLAAEVLKAPIIVETEYKEPVKKIEHILIEMKSDEKKSKLVDILLEEKIDSTIIFTNSKHKAKNLSRILEGKKFKSVHFQGNLSQGQRERALDGFRNGEFKILVATDIAARGLDIPQVTHVINYDMPRTAEAFTHRSGRTGRANKSGTVISFSTSEDVKILKDIIKINKTKFIKK